MAERDYKELIPPKGHEKVGERVFELVVEVIDDKRDSGLTGTEGKWWRNYEKRKNVHWRQASDKVPLVAANLIYRHVTMTVNTLCENNPQFDIIAVGDVSNTPDEVFEDMQRSAEHWWNETEQQDTLLRSVTNNEQYGCTIEKVVFNPDIEYGMGEVETVIVDPFHFGYYPVRMVDPKDLQKCLAVFHFYPLSVYEARARWPKHADEIKPDNEMLEELGVDRRALQPGNSANAGNLFLTIGNAVKEVSRRYGGTNEDSEDVLIVECWCKDYTMETVTVADSEYMDGDTGSIYIEQAQRPKYPGFIRCITVTNCGKLVLEDRPNPSINPALDDETAKLTYLYDKFPFVMVNSLPDTANAWGISDIEMLDQLNKEFNKAVSQLVLDKDRSARKKIINPKTSGVDNNEFTNFAGILNPVNSMEASAIRYLDYPAVPADIMNSIKLFQELFFLVSGTFDVSQAQTSSNGVIAYKAIAALMERAATMINGKIIQMSRLIRERGRMYISNMQNWYTEDRWIPIQSDKGKEMRRINGGDMRFPVKMSVVKGSTMPTSRVQKREEALSLYQAGGIDRREVLKKMEWDNIEEVVKRMEKGPVGELIGRMQEIGIPEPILQVIQEIAGMDPKEFEKAAENGEIPNVSSMLVQMVQQAMGAGKEPTPEEDRENSLAMAEIQAKIAQAEKTQAERDLIIEKIVTERVEQQVKAAGVQFDEEKLKMERARIATEIIEKAKAGEQEAVSNQKNKPGYNEKGMKSNNVEG